MIANVAVLAALIASAAAETVHSVFVFTRHADRTTRMFPGYSLTNLGATQAYQSGQFYRQRYISNDAQYRISGIAADQVNYNQIWASAPNQGLLFQTATNFLQGLYPPLVQLDSQLAAETLTNGSITTDPLGGYQFILIQGQPATNEDTIWIKGDDNCPIHIAAQRSYESSTQYKTVLNNTLPFYSQFNTLLGPILGADGVTYKNAYEVFDLLNVASIHNTSIAGQIDPVALASARYLADEWEWNSNFNASQSARSIGGQAFIGGILRRLNETVTRSARNNKFQLMAGSYDTFLSFFGLTNLTATTGNFYGVPGYGSTLAFELFTENGNATNPAAFPNANAVNSTLRVRFLFRNGTDSAEQLNVFPLFGRNETSLPYGSFVDQMKAVGITTVGEWCTTCASTQNFCVAANQTSASTRPASTSSGSSTPSGLSNAAAGGIGAAVTLVVVAVVGALVMLFMRRRRPAKPTHPTQEKRVSGSESDTPSV